MSADVWAAEGRPKEEGTSLKTWSVGSVPKPPGDAVELADLLEMWLQDQLLGKASLCFASGALWRYRSANKQSLGSA